MSSQEAMGINHKIKLTSRKKQFKSIQEVRMYFSDKGQSKQNTDHCDNSDKTEILTLYCEEK